MSDLKNEFEAPSINIPELGSKVLNTQGTNEPSLDTAHEQTPSKHESERAIAQETFDYEMLVANEIFDQAFRACANDINLDSTQKNFYRKKDQAFTKLRKALSRGFTLDQLKHIANSLKHDRDDRISDLDSRIMSLEKFTWEILFEYFDPKTIELTREMNSNFEDIISPDLLEEIENPSRPFESFESEQNRKYFIRLFSLQTENGLFNAAERSIRRIFEEYNSESPSLFSITIVHQKLEKRLRLLHLVWDKELITVKEEIRAASQEQDGASTDWAKSRNYQFIRLLNCLGLGKRFEQLAEIGKSEKRQIRVPFDLYGFNDGEKLKEELLLKHPDLKQLL